MLKRFLLIGFLSGFISVTTYLVSPKVLSLYKGFDVVRNLPSVNPSPVIKSSAVPAQIQIPELNLALPVVPAHVTGNEWELYDDKISWLATSAYVGEGNVILYGHNRLNLFGRLNKLQAGSEILVLSDDTIQKYRIRELKKVEPTDVQAVLSEKNQLTLYTCEGSFDQKRLVVYAEPVN